MSVVGDEELEAQLGARARARWNADTGALLDDLDDADEDDEALVAAMRARAEAEAAGREDDVEEVEGAAAAQGAEAATEPAANDRRWTWVAVVAAAAAMLLAWAWLRAGRSAELPTFEERAFEGGARTVRGDAPADAVFFPDTRLRWAIAPTASVDADVDIRVHAVGPGDLCLALDRGKRIANSGAIEIAGPLGDLMPLSPGNWSLTLLVAPRETMESLPNPCAPNDAGAYPPGVTSVATHSVSVRPSP